MTSLVTQLLWGRLRAGIGNLGVSHPSHYFLLPRSLGNTMPHSIPGRSPACLLLLESWGPCFPAGDRSASLGQLPAAHWTPRQLCSLSLHRPPAMWGTLWFQKAPPLQVEHSDLLDPPGTWSPRHIWSSSLSSDLQQCAGSSM